MAANKMAWRGSRGLVGSVLIVAVALAVLPASSAAQSTGFPGTLTPPGGPPQLTPPTVIPQNPGESRVPNIGSGGGTLGRPSSIPNPLGYENAIEFRTPKPPRVPSYKYEPPPRRVDPPVLRSERPVAVRKMKPARKEPDEDAD